MRRLPALLLILALTFSCAPAEGTYFRIPQVLVVHAGKPVTIDLGKMKNNPAGTLSIRDAGGNVLAKADAVSGTANGKIVLPADAVPDHGQALTIWFFHDGVDELQGELILAVDDKTEGIRQVQTDEKKIAITFDSTGSGVREDKLLNLLDQYGVKCTFFIQGGVLKSQPEHAVRVSQRGHELANHSMYHPDMREIGNEMILREIRDCSEIIRETTGQEVCLYRPPSGNHTFRDLAISRALGCEPILWTFDSKDCAYWLPLETILGRLEKKSEPGAIILMHDYGVCTIPALETYIPEMQAQGYEFVTVSELLKYSE